MKNLSNLYGEDYFERGVQVGVSLYSHYRWMPESTIPFCAELLSQLGISYEDTILDFGCAKGYLVKAFRLLHREAWGVDVSEYAVSCVPEDVQAYVTLIERVEDIPLPESGCYDWVIVRSVFEHISYADIGPTLRHLQRIGRNLFAIIPLGDGEKFVVPAEELDVTHEIKQGLTWWGARFHEAEFSHVQADYDMPHIVNNYRRWKWGRGYFRCTSV